MSGPGSGPGSTYSPGSWYALVSPSAAVFVDPTMPGPQLDALWEGVLAGRSTADALAVVTASAPPSRLPAFALAAVEGGVVRVVVRGAVQITVQDADGVERGISGAGVEPWREDVVERAEALWFVRPGGGRDGLALPVVCAAVTADILAWQPDGVPRRRPSDHDGVTRHMTSAPVAPSAPSAPLEPVAVREPARPAGVPAATAPAAPVASAPPAIVPPTVARAAEVVPPPLPVVAERAPVVTPVAEPALPAPTPIPQPVLPMAPDATAAPSPVTPSPVTPVPALSAPSAPAPVTPVPALPTPAAATVATPAPRVPVGASSLLGPRRPGLLHFSTGEVVDVDGTVVIGRAPSAPDGEQARLVAVKGSGRGISRTHVKVGVDEIGVYTIDLGSRNGTIVKTPAGESIPLEPGVPHRLRNGQIVAMADVSFEYRALDLP